MKSTIKRRKTNDDGGRRDWSTERRRGRRKRFSEKNRRSEVELQELQQLLLPLWSRQLGRPIPFFISSSLPRRKPYAQLLPSNGRLALDSSLRWNLWCRRFLLLLGGRNLGNCRWGIGVRMDFEGSNCWWSRRDREGRVWVFANFTLLSYCIVETFVFVGSP